MGKGKQRKKSPSAAQATATGPWLKSSTIGGMAILLVPALAFMGALVGSVFSFDAAPLARASWDLFSDLLVAGSTGVGFALLGGLVAAPFDRDSIIPVAMIVGLAAAVGYFLYAITTIAWAISPWGTGIGGGLGALLSVPGGLALCRRDRVPPSVRKAALRATRAPGQGINDLDWWRADPDADDGGTE